MKTLFDIFMAFFEPELLIVYCFGAGVIGLFKGYKRRHFDNWMFQFGVGVVFIVFATALSQYLVLEYDEENKRFFAFFVLGLVMYLSYPVGVYFLFRSVVPFFQKTWKTVEDVEEAVAEPEPEPEEQKLYLPQWARTEHHQIVGGTGQGKTVALHDMIAEDVRGLLSSVIVMDSQGDLINTILKWDVDDERIVLIDPTDIEYPPCLNLFDVGMDRINELSPYERERHINSVISLYDFVLGSLLGAELTQKQDVAFRFVMRLILQIPGATIHTLRELFSPGGYEKYSHYVEQLPETAQAFFKNEFTNERAFGDTKQQVVRRLYGILENTTLERMFNNPHNKINIADEINQNKLILINTSKDLLKTDGSQLFGRFFIALIAQAVIERASLAPDQRRRTYFYIDEAHEYFDETMVELLEQARKYNCGMIFAHQNLDQLGTFKRAAMGTSIKFVGGVSMSDARALASNMRIRDPELLVNAPRLSFWVSVKDREPFRYTFDPAKAGHVPKRIDQTRLRNIIRQKYCRMPEVTETYIPPKDAPASAPMSKPEKPRISRKEIERREDDVDWSDEL